MPVTKRSVPITQPKADPIKKNEFPMLSINKGLFRLRCKSDATDAYAVAA